MTYRISVDPAGNILYHYGQYADEYTELELKHPELPDLTDLIVYLDNEVLILSDELRDMEKDYWNGTEWAQKTEKTENDSPLSEWDGSNWVDHPEIRERQEAELSVMVRGTRNVLLFDSDWTQLADSPLSDSKKEEWAVYRQELRDFPAQDQDTINIFEFVWPTNPDGGTI